LKETARFQSYKCFTFLTDGWEDKRHRSLTGCVAARMSGDPIVLGLVDMTGNRGSAEGYMRAALESMGRMEIDASLCTHFRALTTDNPTVMQAF
jgi:hypothetical protein